MNREIKQIIKQDMIRNRGYVLNIPQFIKLMLWEPYNPTRFLVLLRLANCYTNLRSPIRTVILRMYYRSSFRFGYEISPKTKIGAGLRLPRWGVA